MSGIYNSYWHRKIRPAILARDHGICWLCGQPGATTVDHVIPLCEGGAPYDPANLRAAHGKQTDTCPGNYQRNGQPPPPLATNSRHW